MLHQGEFAHATRIDDILTDAFLRRDGAGYSLHGGYALTLGVPAPAFEVVEVVEGLTVNRASRRSDEVVLDDVAVLTESGFCHAGVRDGAP